MPTSAKHITQLLLHMSQDDADAKQQLWDLVYAELRQLADHRLARHNRSIGATALVHDAYLKLEACKDLSFEDRRHFFGTAARAMRNLLVDEARSSRSLDKRLTTEFAQAFSAPESDVPPIDLIALDDSLRRFEGVDTRAAKVVSLKFFGGLTIPEIAGVMDVSEATVERDWQFARSWLFREMQQ